MARDKNTYSPDSLLRLFDPPDGFAGDFGFLCGYSADVHFMCAATDRFSAHSNWNPRNDGRIGLLLMLDSSNPQLLTADVPGMLHLGFRRDKEKSFGLMHAKVALLGFQATDTDADDWRLRLIVSTGNWTRQTLEESLDLAWVIEISKGDLKNKEKAQDALDCLAAWDMLNWLRQYYSFPFPKINSAAASSENQIALRRFEKYLEELRPALRPKDTLRPRFIDSRKKPFLNQLAEQIIHHDDDKLARNYLAMGSGFFESGNTLRQGDVPSTLNNIFEELRGQGLLIRQPEVDIFVNQNACQAVAKAIDGIIAKGWQIRPAGQPKFFSSQPRSLHGKFLFSASCRKNSKYCLDPWLYLGSGNLTKRGFCDAFKKGGNLEAGVIFAPEPHSLVWQKDDCKKGSPQEWLGNRLPVQWEKEIKKVDDLQEGAGLEINENCFLAPPFACVLWLEEDGQQYIEIPETESLIHYIEVLTRSGQACCAASVERRYLWPEQQRPLSVTIRWQEGEKLWEACVSVMDVFGGVAVRQTSSASITDAWLELAGYPARNDDNDGGGDDSPDGDDDGGTGTSRGQAEAANYPVRQMMQLVENIAAKQCELHERDWAVWLNRLERVLNGVAKTEKNIECFRQWGLNPLAPLFHTPFRPAFAENSDTEEGKNYEAMLHRLETSWGVAGLHSLGDK